MSEWVLSLNKYQRDNLLWLLSDLIGWGQPEAVRPFDLAHTGDWVGEIASQLQPGASREPNVTSETISSQVKSWLDSLRG